MALFDTDVLIDQLRGNEGAKKLMMKFQYEQNSCSVITSGEILFGMRIEEEEKTFALINNLEEIPVNSDIIRLARDIKTKAKGFQLELYDCIIAATAIKYNHLLVTRNAKHYPDNRLKIFAPNY